MSGSTVLAGAPDLNAGGHVASGSAYVFAGPLPTVTITSPASGAKFTRGKLVDASYSCADTGGPGLASCQGTVAQGSPIDTTTLGKHAFTVTATDANGAQSSQSVNYTVVAPPVPTVTITSPANGATFKQGHVVKAAYSCADTGGPGLASCKGTVAPGSPIATSTLGKRNFTVTATDAFGTHISKTVSYTVVAVIPVLGNVHESAHKWQEHKTSKKTPPVGTTFSFTLNEPARVTFRFTLDSGREVGHKCVPQTTANAHDRQCKLRRPEGALSFSAHTGSNSKRFVGRLATGKLLPLGSYTVTITASIPTGQKCTPRTLVFKIVE
jgi:hypothetical protein